MQISKIEHIDNSKYIFHLDGIVGHGLSGYIIKKDCLYQRLWVELVTDDDCVLSIARAQHYHSDASLGDGCYGFLLSIPPAIFYQNMPLLTNLKIRLANTNITFSRFELSVTNKDSLNISNTFYDGVLTIWGWVIDKEKPDSIVEVSAYHKGRLIKTVKANKHISNVYEDIGHDFIINLPTEFANGNIYEIDILDNKGKPLFGSPVVVQSCLHALSNIAKDTIETNNIYKELIVACIERYERFFDGNIELSYYNKLKQTDQIIQTHTSNHNMLIIRETQGLYDPEGLVDLSKLKKLAQKKNYIILNTEQEDLYIEKIGHLIEALDKSDAIISYGDEELCVDNEITPIYKPAWDFLLYYGMDYLGPIIVKSSLIKSLKEDSNLTLNLLKTRLVLMAKNKIAHFPNIVCKRYIPYKAPPRELLQQWLEKDINGIKVIENPYSNDLNRLLIPLLKPLKISIIIPTRDNHTILKKCINSLYSTTKGYEGLEIIVVDNNTTNPHSLKYLKELSHSGIKIILFKNEFNFSAMVNLAALQSSGDILIFVNNDIVFLQTGWLQEMMSYFQFKDIAIVGARLQYPNGIIQHGGVIVGPLQLAGHVGNNWHKQDAGYMNRNILSQQWSAVTAACMMINKEVFLENNGFDELQFPVQFNDVDYCLRIRQKGYIVAYTPFVNIIHYESMSRGKSKSDKRLMENIRSDMEFKSFRKKWGGYSDPFYNPNFSMNNLSYPFESLSIPINRRNFRL